jgi:hypothetical protein
MRHYLIIANQTLGGAELQQEIRRRSGSEPSEFWVLVPATPQSDLAVVPPAGLIGTPDAAGVSTTALGAVPDEGTALAEKRLAQELDRLRTTGVVADGEIGDPDPIQAIQDTLRVRQFDEIVLVTLPQGISRWLHQDLPHRVQRKFGLPLTHIVGS